MKKFLFLTATVFLMIGCKNPVSNNDNNIKPDDIGCFDIIHQDGSYKLDLVAVSYYDYQGEYRIFNTDKDTFVLKALANTEMVFIGIYDGMVTTVERRLMVANLGFIY